MSESYVGRYTWVVGAGIISCFIMAFSIGANDVANNFSTSVGSKALSLGIAVCLAAVLETLGATLLGGAVTDVIRSHIIDFKVFDNCPEVLMFGMLCSLLGAGFWLIMSTKAGMPVSTTHSIIGSLLGFGLASGNIQCVQWNKVFLIFLSWLVAPISSALFSSIIFVSIRKYILRSQFSLQRCKRWCWLFVFFTAMSFCFFVVFKNPFTIAEECWQLSSAGGPIVYKFPCVLSDWAAAHFFFAFMISLCLAIILTFILSVIIHKVAVLRIKKYEKSMLRKTHDQNNTLEIVEIHMDDVTNLSIGKDHPRKCEESYAVSLETQSTTIVPTGSDYCSTSCYATPDGCSNLLADETSNNSQITTCGCSNSSSTEKYINDPISNDMCESRNSQNCCVNEENINFPLDRSFQEGKTGRNICNIRTNEISNDYFNRVKSRCQCNRTIVSFNNLKHSLVDNKVGVTNCSSCSSGCCFNYVPNSNHRNQYRMSILAATRTEAVNGLCCDYRHSHSSRNLISSFPIGLCYKSCAAKKKWPTLPWFRNIHVESSQEDEFVNKLNVVSENFDAKTEIFFSVFQVLSASLGCIAHSANDTANAVGPLAAILTIYYGTLEDKCRVDWYILLLGGLSISLGLALLGYRVIKTVGMKLVKITPARGFSIDLGAALVVLLFSSLGVPLSTTHCAVGSTVGVGLMEKEANRTYESPLADGGRTATTTGTRICSTLQLGNWPQKIPLNLSSVNWRLFGGIFVSWVGTVFFSAGVTMALFSFAVYAPSL